MDIREIIVNLSQLLAITAYGTAAYLFLSMKQNMFELGYGINVVFIFFIIKKVIDRFLTSKSNQQNALSYLNDISFVIFITSYVYNLVCI